MQFALSFHPHKLLFFTHYNDEMARSHTIIVKLPHLTRGDGLMSSEIVFLWRKMTKKKAVHGTQGSKRLFILPSPCLKFSV